MISSREIAFKIDNFEKTTTLLLSEANSGVQSCLRRKHRRGKIDADLHLQQRSILFEIQLVLIWILRFTYLTILELGFIF